MIVIDLGLDRGEPETYASPTRRTVPDWFAPFMIALLVLVSSGASAAPPPPPLTRLLSLQVGPADSYVVADGQLLAQTPGSLSAYDLSTGRPRWSADTTGPTYRLRTGSGVVLLRPWAIGPGEPSTTALSLSTGTARWNHPGSVVTIPGSQALFAVAGVGSLAGSGRRVRGSVESIDADTGLPRWRIDIPATAVLLGVPGSPQRMLLVHDDNTLALHDMDSGRLLAAVALPAADYSPDNPAVSGGLLILRHPGVDGPEVSAYDPATLVRRWHRPAEGAYLAAACGRLTCLVGPTGVRALDPADGTERWYRPGWQSVELRGDVLLAYPSPMSSGAPVGTVDPETGRVLVDLRGWHPLIGPGAGDRLIVIREVVAGARTMVAVAGPGDARPLPLADLSPGTGDCQSVSDRLICRTMAGELVVWAYRRRG